MKKKTFCVFLIAAQVIHVKIKLGTGGTTPVYYSKGVHEGEKLLINKIETNLLSGGKN